MAEDLPADGPPALSAEEAFARAKEELIRRTPQPVFWLFGKTQSGKSTIIRFLTGLTDISIGLGFRPTTRQSAVYDFPSAEAPLLRFLDTRGLGEVRYDPTEDLARFNDETQLVLVTVRLNDMALEPILEPLRRIRRARPGRPVLLAVTCLHLAYPQQQHPPYRYHETLDPPEAPAEVRRLLAEHRRLFEPLVDAVVPLDLTRPEEGFNDPNYGGDHLRATLLRFLPDAYRQSVLNLHDDLAELKELYLQRAMPHIMSLAAMAGTAGAVPVPFVDIPIVAGLQTRLVYKLARLYGQPQEAKRFLEMAGVIGLGMLGRAAVRQVTKFIPWVGSLAGGAYSFGSTYAIGRGACWYYGEVLAGHVPRKEEVQSVLGGAFETARRLWESKPASSETGAGGKEPAAAAPPVSASEKAL